MGIGNLKQPPSSVQPSSLKDPEKLHKMEWGERERENGCFNTLKVMGLLKSKKALLKNEKAFYEEPFIACQGVAILTEKNWISVRTICTFFLEDFLLDDDVLEESAESCEPTEPT